MKNFLKKDLTQRIVITITKFIQITIATVVTLALLRYIETMSDISMLGTAVVVRAIAFLGMCYVYMKYMHK